MTNTLEPPDQPAPQDTAQPSLSWESELHGLRFHWSPPYRICTDGETWTASPLEHPAVVLTAESADELRLAIRDHYSKNPDVQRTARDHAGLGDCWCGQTHGPERSSI